ncbi:MAG: TetR/AcrR family transcriptional regulator [Pseudomonadota bacterium]
MDDNDTILAPISYPKRQKKKAETRKKILEASLELFFERQLDDVTLEDVAERAGIHVQTLYRHFPNKVSLMVAGDELWLDRFRSYMSKDHDSDTFEMWREWLIFAYREFLKDIGKYRKLYQHKAESMPALFGLWRIQIDYENELCQSLAKDFRMSADDVGMPRLVAGMLIAGNAAVIRRFIRQETDFMRETLETVDRVESQFKHLVIRD